MKKLIAFALTLGAVVALVLLIPNGAIDRSPETDSGHEAKTKEHPAQNVQLSSGTIALRPPTTEELIGSPRSPLADALGTAAVSPASEPKMVYELFRFYLREIGSYPAGESNTQWINALRGANPDRLAILPADHPRLSPKGELLDAWRVPFFIHQISRSEIQIRSAGPDQIIFSADDIIFPEQMP